MNTIQHKPLLVFAVTSIAIMLLPQHIRELFYLHIDNVKHGEYWRLFSAHFTHYSWVHCLSNIIGIFLLAGIFNNTKYKMNWLLVAIITCITISYGLILFSTQLTWYLGFSGLLTSLYAYAAIKTLNENIMVSTIILIALLTYIAIQLFEGELISSMLLADLNTSSYAHAYGIVTGVMVGIIEKYIVCKDTTSD